MYRCDSCAESGNGRFEAAISFMTHRPKQLPMERAYGLPLVQPAVTQVSVPIIRLFTKAKTSTNLLSAVRV